MERHKRRLIIRTIVAVFLITTAIGIIGALTPQQGAMQPTPTVTSSLGAIPPYADRATATPPAVRVATGTPPPVPTATIMARSDATDRVATPVAPAPCPPCQRSPPKRASSPRSPIRPTGKGRSPPKQAASHP